MVTDHQDAFTGRTRKSPGVPRALAGVAALLLAITGAFHATGYRDIVEIVSDAAFGPFYSQALPGIWIFFSWHLIALALGAAWASLSGSAAARPVLIFIALVVAVDTLFVSTGAGVLFVGTLMLAGAAVSLAISAARWRTT